ncbi:major facilitator superfamily transporter multidrug resistance [Xylariomycetidae sp. FL2044]|nr:major facilitator superfamily transporter multidrug resistance [Xylariomycetidae sp. FL2044]
MMASEPKVNDMSADAVALGQNGQGNTTAVDNKLQDPPRVLNGWRLHLSMFGLCSALLFSALETTIISTSLPTIGAYFNDYNMIGWVVTAYLVTYSSFLLAYAKLSDIFGQRNTLLVALFLFALFSGLCAASEHISLTSLIVFRALQGMGGSGVYSVVFVTSVDICPARLLGLYSSVVSSTFAIANVLGPIIGGAICDTGDWKWIFLLNVPGAVLAGCVIFIALPGGDGGTGGKSPLQRVDVVGSLLSVGGAVMIIYGLQTGGAQHPWDDAQVIGTIVAGGIAIILFFVYEDILGRRGDTPVIEPVFPLRLLKNPRLCSLLMTAFLGGGVFYASVVNIPQQNQIVHLSTPTEAGVQILPIMVLSPVASVISGFIFSKTIRFGWMILVLGSVLSLLGVGLLIELPYSDGILPRMFGYEVILGFGLGVVMPAFLVLGRVEVEDRDNASIMGAINSIRTMGGTISLSICSAILHSQQETKLDFLPKDVVDFITLSPTSVIPSLPAEEALRTREAFHDIYRLQFIAITVWGGATLLSSLVPFYLNAGSKKHGGKTESGTVSTET